MRKIKLVIVSLFFVIILLEIGLRAGGFVLLSLQEHKNKRLLGEKDIYHIICLGGSTTYCGGRSAYPFQLEKILNERGVGLRFKVVNKGVPGIETDAILFKLEENLNKYEPDMLVVMMGINDCISTMPYEESLKMKTKLFFRGFRIYKLASFIRLSIMNKAGKLKICKVSGKEKPKKEVMEVNSNEDKAYIDLGHYHREEGRYKEAEQMYKRAIELSPNNDNTYVDLGYCYREEGKYKEAEENYKKAIEINPNNTAGHFKLGFLYRAQGRYKEAEETQKKAIEAYKKAIEIGPHEESLYLEMGSCYIELVCCYRAQGRYKEAEELHKKIEKVYYPYKEYAVEDRFYGLAAIIYMQQGEYKEAERYFEKANESRLKYYNPATRHNYRKLKEIAAKRGVRLVCVQYPLYSIEPLKNFFDSTKDIVFVDNEKIFKNALGHGKFEDYFINSFGGEFGHFTRRGRQLLSENIANVIIKEIFNKQ